MSEEYKPINNLWKDSEGYRYFGTLKLSSKIKYNGDDFIPLWEWVEQLQKENEKYKKVIDKLNKYLHTRAIKKCYNGKLYCGFDGLQAQVFEDILKEVSE